MQPPAAIHQYWCSSLHEIARNHRWVVISYSRAFLPLLPKLGGPSGADEIRLAAQDVCRWWGGAIAGADRRRARHRRPENAKDEEPASTFAAPGLAFAQLSRGASALVEYLVSAGQVPDAVNCLDRAVRMLARVREQDELARAVKSASFAAVSLFDLYARDGNLMPAERLYRQMMPHIRVRRDGVPGREAYAGVAFGLACVYCTSGRVGPAAHLRDRLWALARHYPDETFLFEGVRRLNANLRQTRDQAVLDEIWPEFAVQLHKAGMAFSPPPGFEIVRPDGAMESLCDCLVRSTTVRLEVGYRIESAGNAATGTLAENGRAILSGLGAKLAANPVDQIYTFPREAVRREFGAERGGTIHFQVDPRLGLEYERCAATVLYAGPHRTSYILQLLNDYVEVQAESQTSFYALRFGRSGATRPGRSCPV
jgi:hypothetical protein